MPRNTRALLVDSAGRGKCNDCSNPIVGKRPSFTHLTLVSFTGFGIQSSLNFALSNWYSRQERSAGWRYTAEYGIAIPQAIISTFAVRNNIRVYDKQCAAAGLKCGSIF